MDVNSGTTLHEKLFVSYNLNSSHSDFPEQHPTQGKQLLPTGTWHSQGKTAPNYIFLWEHSEHFHEMD